MREEGEIDHLEVGEGELKPSELKVRNATKKLKIHKAVGVDGIYVEMLKTSLKILHDGGWMLKWKYVKVEI